VKRDVLSKKAHDELIKAISSLNPGSHISARKFAVDIGISYTPVREAFLELVNEGALRLEPGVGFFVQSFDFRDMMQYYETRECLEPFVMSKVLYEITGEHLDKLNELNGNMGNALEKGDTEGFIQHDISWHLLFFTVLENSHLLKFYRSLREQYLLCSKKVAKTFNSLAIDEHKGIMKAIEARDKELASAKMREHIQNAKERTETGYIAFGKRG
jgi:DNA-binding GntR family transcriptional regulator